MVQISSSKSPFMKTDDGFQKVDEQKNSKYTILNPQALENRVSQCFTKVCDCDNDIDCGIDGCDLCATAMG
ncbi:MAG: hypothetical protein KR126chlam6_00560 [Candidatus Anoxychlamydiales bacterium]|nr:hypothetical protein [Candidatus Anoxychlamydiales bacterium]